jgi:hypothetical protein
MLLRSVPPSCRACCNQRDVKVLSETRVILQKTTRLCVPPPRADRGNDLRQPRSTRRIFLPRASNARILDDGEARQLETTPPRTTTRLYPLPGGNRQLGRALSQTSPCVTALRASLPAIYIPVELKARTPRPIQECTCRARGPLGNEDHVSRIEPGRCQRCI